MEKYKNGYPLWLARSQPAVNLRDGPAIKIRGKPPFAAREGPMPRGNPSGITGLWQHKYSLFYKGQNCLRSQWYANLSTFEGLDNVRESNVREKESDR